MGVIWSKEQDMQLIEWWRDFSAGEIGKKFAPEVSRAAVLGRIFRLRHKLGVEVIPAKDEGRPQKPRAVRCRPPRRAARPKFNFQRLDEVYTLALTPKKFIPEPTVELPRPDGMILGCHEAIAALKPQTCRYSYGEVKDPDFGFCCRPVKDENSSYCPEHHRLTHRFIDEVPRPWHHRGH